MSCAMYCAVLNGLGFVDCVLFVCEKGVCVLCVCCNVMVHGVVLFVLFVCVCCVCV